MGKMTTTKIDTSKTKTDAYHFKAYLSQGTREGALILLIAVCVFLLMALITHSPQDPGFASTGSHKIVQNFGGKAGALSSDILLYFFGNVAYLFPLLIAYRASVLFKQRRQNKAFHWPMFLIRLSGFLMTILGATGLLSLYTIAGLNDSSGGVIGKEFSNWFKLSFNLSGSTLLLVAMLLMGLTLFTGISWLGLMDRTGALTLRICRFTKATSLRLWDRIQDKRALSAERKLQQHKAPAAKQVSSPPVAKPLQINGRFDDTPHQPEPQLIQRLLSTFSLKKLFKRDAQKVISSQASQGRIEPGLDDGIPLLKPEAGPFDKVSKELSAEASDGPLVIKAGSLSQKTANGSSETEGTNKAGIKISPFVKKSQQVRSDADKQGHLFIASEGPLPSLNLLDLAESNSKLGYSKETLEHMSRLLEEKLADFGVKAEVVEVNPGPVITRFEIQPAPGVKVSKISNLAKE